MNENYLEVKEVYKNFGNKEVLKNINLSVKKGEFFVILGPSGCGKTTLLKIIAGLLNPEKGKILLEGNDITNLEPHKRDIAMVFQNYALYPHMKVKDNILFPLNIRKIDEEEKRKRLKWVSEFLKIEYLLDKKPSQLSGGEQQRVALARALVRKPKLFLMDEPLSNLDAKLRTEMRSFLKELQKKLNITTIYVTHDQVEAMTLADKICVMDKGEIKQTGTPEEIYEKPNNLFVASFIGTHGINIVEIDGYVLCVRPEKFNETKKDESDYEFHVRLIAYDFLGEGYLLKVKLKKIIHGNKEIVSKIGDLKIFSNYKPKDNNLVFYVKEKDIYKFKKNV